MPGSGTVISRYGRSPANAASDDKNRQPSVPVRSLSIHPKLLAVPSTHDCTVSVTSNTTYTPCLFGVSVNDGDDATSDPETPPTRLSYVSVSLHDRCMVKSPTSFAVCALLAVLV